MNNNWPDQNHSRIKLEHLYYRAWSRMRFFYARYMKGTIVIESLPGLWMCRGRHSLREWTQKHTLREYANFLHLKVAGDCYISLFHLWWSKKTEAVSLWCLLWLPLFPGGQSVVVSSAAPESPLSEALNQVYSETLRISIHLNGFLTRRLLNQQVSLGHHALFILIYLFVYLLLWELFIHQPSAGRDSGSSEL